jgi:hypothetical protein
MVAVAKVNHHALCTVREPPRSAPSWIRGFARLFVSRLENALLILHQSPTGPLPIARMELSPPEAASWSRYLIEQLVSRR